MMLIIYVLLELLSSSTTTICSCEEQDSRNLKLLSAELSFLFKHVKPVRFNYSQQKVLPFLFKDFLLFSA